MTRQTEAAEIDQLWDYSQPAESERRFRERLANTAPDGDPEVRAQLLTQIARAQGLQREFEAAHATLDTAQRMLTDRMTLGRARYLLERGRVHNSAGQKALAGPLFREALALAERSGDDFYAVDAAHMLGICEPPEAQAAWGLKALALAERSSDPRARKWLGSLYNNLGWTRHDQGDYAGALELFEKGVAFREAQGQAAELLIARWCVARCLRSLGRVQEALIRQQALLAEHQAAGSSDGYVAEEIGECLLALGRGDEARPYFHQAHAVLSQDPWLAANEGPRLERLRELGGAV